MLVIVATTRVPEVRDWQDLGVAVCLDLGVASTLLFTASKQ